MISIRHQRSLAGLCAVAVTVTACGGSDDADPALVESDDAAVQTTDVDQPVSSAPTSTADSAPARTTEPVTDDPEPVEPTVCRDGDVPGPTESALDAPHPVGSPVDEPSWVVSMREPRIVDGDYLIGDLEASMGETAPLVLESGEYQADSFGGSSVLTLEEPWRLMRADPGLLVFGGADDPLLQDRPVFLVGWPRGLPTPAAAASLADSPLDQTALSPVPDDLATWLDEIDAVAVLGCSPITVFGESGFVYDVEVDPDAGETTFCMPLGRCVTSFGWYTSGPATATTVHLSDRNRYRIWHVPHEQGGFVAVAIAPPDEFDDWVARSARLLVGLDVDLSDGPPLSAEQFGAGRGIVSAGEVTPLSLPAISVELDEPAWAATFSRGFVVGSLDHAPPWQEGPYGEVFVVDTGVDGPITSVDEAIDALGRVGTVAELPDETMLGLAATVVSVTADEATRVFRKTTAEVSTGVEEEGFGWYWIHEGPQVIWLVPTDDRLFAVASWTGADGDLETAVELTRSVFAEAEVNTAIP